MKRIVLNAWTNVAPEAAFLQRPNSLFQTLQKFIPVPLTLLLLLFAGIANAQQWQILGSEQAVSSVSSNYTNIALVNSGAGSVPYVVYTESGVARVKKLQGDGAWVQVGGTLAGNASYTRIYADKNGGLYVTYVDVANASRLAVKKYNAGTDAWEPLQNNSANLYTSSGTVNGMSGVSQYGSTPRSSLAFDSNNTPYIAFAEGSTLVPYVKKFDGASWVTVGGSPVVSTLRAVAMSLVLDESNTPWLVFCNVGTTSTGTTGSMALYNYNGSAWTAIPSTIGSIRHTFMALNAAGNPAIVYFNANTGANNRATVAVYNKTAGTWGSGTALSTRDAAPVSLIRDGAGNLYCAFVDAVTTSFVQAARVFKQYAQNAGTATWKELKDPLLTTITGIEHSAGNLHIAVGSDTAKPFVVYTKGNSLGVVTPVVRMFIPPANPAVLSTNAVAGITTTSAQAGGNITSDGGSPVTERGVVYSNSNSLPTTADAKVADASGGTGPFTVTVNGLSQATFYYVRAYATNAGGTTYGTTVRLNSLSPADAVVNTPKQMEYLTRGAVAVRRNTATVFVSWRLLGTDPSGIAFNLYRDGVKVNASPIATSTNYIDSVTTNGTYFVRPILNGVEGAPSQPVSVWASNQLSIPLQIPAGGITFDGEAYTYSANDCSVGDVDGDGVYEIFVKWDPSALNHNSGGYSGDQIIDCYKMDGTHLWRINLGKNLNAGPHFTQFMVYDLDGDGKAEIAMKTADGTIDGQGVVIGDATVDHRNTGGWAYKGPEFLTVFNGLTGAAMATVPYPFARGSFADWGDTYGNRAERYVNAIAYLDGARPSLIIGRGYYDRLTRSAYDWRNGQLTLRWKFDSKDPAHPEYNAYSSQGNHQMTIGDVDGDGKDEVINGSSAIDDDGSPLWTYGNGHGDALHMTDMDPDRPGQEIWINLESPGDYDGQGLRQYNAKTGETNWGVATTGDVGRSLAADVDPAHRGYEMWGSSGNLYNAKGEQIGTAKPTGGSQAVNSGIWWDGDLGRELLDGTILDKWNPITKSLNRVFTIYNAAPVSSSNDTKKNPGLQADLLGDWREEIILRRSDNTALILFTTTSPTDYRIPTLMHDAQYRTAVAWQNSAYNQPPYPSFYLGYDMETPPMPNIAVKDIVAPEVSLVTRQAPETAQGTATSVTYRVIFTEDVTGVDAGDFTLAATGNLAGAIASVTAVSPSVYEVTVNDLTGEGELRLDVNASNTGIADASANALTAGFTTGEVYTRVKGEQTITFDALENKLVGDDAIQLAATASSGLTVSYSSSNPEVAAVNNGTLHIVGAGTATITATQAGDNDYKAATAVDRELTVEKRDQAITFNAFTEKQVGDDDFAAGAAAASGLAITYSSSNTDVAAIMNGLVHIVGAGTTTITATQAGNYMYHAATPVEQTLTVVKKSQAITFGEPGEKAYGIADFDAGATASSGLAVAYTSSNMDVATIVNGKVHIIGLGTTLIAASQQGNYMYEAAPTEVRSLTVSDMTKPTEPQALTTTKTADGKVGLMWMASTDDVGVTGYYIFLNGKQLNQEPVTATSYVTDAPAGSLVYAYTVIAADAAGNLSQESATALFTNSNGNGSSNQMLEILKVFPNPNAGNFKVRLNSRETGNVVIDIFNSNGVLVQSVSDSKQSDVYQREFKLQSVPKGMYLIRVAAGASFLQTGIVLIQ